MVQPCQAVSHLSLLLMRCFVTVYERNELPKCIPLLAVFYKHECMSWVSKLKQTQRPAWPPWCEPKRSFKQSHCSHRLKTLEDWAAADQHLGCSSARMTGIHQIMKTPCERARTHTHSFHHVHSAYKLKQSVVIIQPLNRFLFVFVHLPVCL